MTKRKGRVVNIGVKDVYVKLKPIVVFGKESATVKLVKELVEEELGNDKHEVEE